MKRILVSIVALMLMLNLATAFESPQVTSNDVIAEDVIYEPDDEDHGGLRG